MNRGVLSYRIVSKHKIVYRKQHRCGCIEAYSAKEKERQQHPAQQGGKVCKEMQSKCMNVGLEVNHQGPVRTGEKFRSLRTYTQTHTHTYACTHDTYRAMKTR